MQINNNGDTAGSVYATNVTFLKDEVATAGAGAANAASDMVTLSSAAMKLADEIGKLNDAMAQLPSSPPTPKPHVADGKKKHFTSQLAMLDVDALRLIRDKLRSQNLGVKGVSPTEQDIKTDKAQATAIQQ